MVTSPSVIKRRKALRKKIFYCGGCPRRSEASVVENESKTMTLARLKMAAKSVVRSGEVYDFNMPKQVTKSSLLALFKRHNINPQNYL